MPSLPKLLVTFTNGAGVVTDYTAGDGLFWFGLAGDGLPPYETYFTRSFQQEGETYRTARAGARTIVARIGVEGDGYQDLLERAHAFEVAHSPRYGEGVLTFTMPDGVTERRVAAAPTGPLTRGEDELDLYSRRYAVQFKAGDPWFYDPAEETTSFTAGAGGGGVTFPVTFPVAFATSAPLMGEPFTLAYAGSAPTWPTWTVDGPAVNPALLNLTTGQQVRFSGTVPDGATLTVVMAWGQERATLTYAGGTFDWLGYLGAGSEFWAIVPGDNVILVARDAPVFSGSAQMTYHNRYESLGG